jgi:hypothetical protein
MARIRTIKPEFPQSESMGRVSRESRLCFILLWTIADDSGRLRGNSRMLASLLYPYDDDAKKHVDGWLEQLTGEGCITRYEVDGTSYIQILNWSSHQKIDKPSASKIPPFAEASRSLANPLEASPLDQGRDQGKEGNVCAEPRSDSTPESGILIPLNDGVEFDVPLASIAEWREAYPAVNIEQELRKMRVWCLNNPKNRKTKSGVKAFANSWLSREQNKAPRIFGAATNLAGNGVAL